MSKDDSHAGKPAFPATVARSPSQGPSLALRLSVGPSPELLWFLKEHPGGQISFDLPRSSGRAEESGLIGAGLGALIGTARWQPVQSSRTQVTIAPALNHGVGAGVAVSF